MTQGRRYIWQFPAWPEFQWDSTALLKLLGDCRFQQGSLLAQMRELGFEVQQQARAEVLIEEALKTSEIEGVHLDTRAVRSSVARRLGLPSAGLPDPTVKQSLAFWCSAISTLCRSSARSPRSPPAANWT